MKNFTLQKSVLLLLMALLFAPFLQAQVYNGDLTLSSQAEVDAFNYTYVTGYLYIYGADITNLNTLSVLTTVGDYLYIRENPALTNIDSLDALTTVGGYLRFRKNFALTNIDGLAALTSVGGNLLLQENTALTNIDGLAALTSVGGVLSISGTTALTNIDGLSAITSFSDKLQISNNTALTNIDVLLAHTSFGGDLDIIGNDNLNNLNGLSNLTSVGGDLRISNMPALTNLDDLAALTSVGGNLGLDYNEALTNINSLAALTSVGEHLTIQNNDTLINIDGLAALTSVGGRLDIKNNDALLNIDGLAVITSAEDNITIYNNVALTNIDGLSAITSMGDDLIIERNDALTNIDGLSALTSVEDNLVIRDNDALLNIDGLAALTSAGNKLELADNDALLNIDGLSALTSVGGRVDINSNTALLNIDGLAALTSVSGNLRIYDHPVLTNIDGLAALITVGEDLQIRQNPAITNIDSLAALTSVGEDLKIGENALLAEFCGLYPLLQGDGLGGVYEVYDNAANPTQQQVIDDGQCIPIVPTLLYKIYIFTESSANDGSISNELPIFYASPGTDFFTGSNGIFDAGKYTASNLPAGLTMHISKISDTTLSVSLLGNATSHTQADDISNLEIAFNNAAFNNGDASAVSYATKSDIGVDFMQEYYVASSGGDVTTIEAAIAAAADGDRILLAAETFTENELIVNKKLCIRGQGADLTIIQAHAMENTATHRVFTINEGIRATIENITIRHGYDINNKGAGIYNEGKLSILNSTICNNTAKQGGGLYNKNSGSKLTITNCLICNNTADDGGGIFANAGKSDITNSTLTGNSANQVSYSGGKGGAIYGSYGSEVTLSFCTIAGNSSTKDVGGICANQMDFFISNTIIANNGISDYHVAYGANKIDNGNNIIGMQTYEGFPNNWKFTDTTNILYNYQADGTAATSWNRNNVVLSNQNLNLSDTLADNGGATQTLAAACGSFAIGAGAADAAVTTDQRGYVRNGAPTIGAYEQTGPEPQAKNLLFKGIDAHSAHISWENGGGSMRVVFMKAGTTGEVKPINGSYYSGFEEFGVADELEGWSCVYNGNGNAVTVTGLSRLTTYRAQIFEYCGTNGSQAYNTSTGTLNPANFATTNILIVPNGTSYWEKDVTWNYDTVFVMGETTLESPLTLTIVPGSLIEFNTESKSSKRPRAGFLQIDGKLIAEGTATDSIYFTRLGDTGNWEQIYFAPDADTTSSMKYCNVEFADKKWDNGAVFIDQTQVNIDHCRISNNLTTGLTFSSAQGIMVQNSYVSDNAGNGIHIEGFIDKGSVFPHTIKGNRICSNGGSGIGHISNQYVLIDSNEICNNTANGIYKYEAPVDFTISNNLIKQNGAAGIKVENAASFLVANNQVCENTGDGIEIKNGAANWKLNKNKNFGNGGVGLSINNGPSNGSIIEDSIAGNGSNGVVIFYGSNYNKFVNCYIVNNDTSGVYCYEGGNNSTFINCLIADNSGYGFYITDGSSVQYLINTTIANNSQFGLFASNGSAYDLENSIVWENTLGSDSIHGESGGSLTKSYCCFEDNSKLEQGNISGDPLFCNASIGDYSLSSLSPCLNAGNPDTTGLNLPDTDLNNQNRILGDTIDMGAYELNLPSAWAGSDTTILYNQSYKLAEASAENYTSISWSTAGDGSFSDTTALQPDYTPGENDVIAGTVALTMAVLGNSPCSITTDDVTLTFIWKPEIVITSPTDQDAIYDTVTTVTGTASDHDNDLSEIYVRVNDGAWQLATGTENWSLDIPLTFGNKKFEAKAVDAKSLESELDEITIFSGVQFITLNEGWSHFSSFLDPVDGGIETIMEYPVGLNLISLMVNNSGQLYWPSQNINNIGNWNYKTAYKICIDEQSTILFKGDLLDETSLQLGSGAKYLPVLTNVEVAVDEAFENPMQDIRVMFNHFTNEIYWPGGGIFTLQKLMPGDGYLVNLINSATVTFPDYDLDVSETKSSQIVFDQNSPWLVTKTGDVHLISIFNNALAGMENYSHIGAFDSQNDCIGSANITEKGANVLLAVYGDDAYTETRDGAEEGEFISFRAYDPITGLETSLEASYQESFPNHDGLFAISGLSAISEFKESASGIGGSNMALQISVYPNPAKDELNITLTGFKTLPGLEASLISIEGNLVKTFDIQTAKTKINISDLQPGVYVLKIVQDGEIVYKKVVVR